MSDVHCCERWAESVSLAAAGCLAPDDESDVRRHLETCSKCRERFRQLTELCGLLAESRLPADGVEAASVQRVMSALQLTRSRPSIVRRWIPRPFDRARTAGLSVPRTYSSANWRWIMRHPVSRAAATAVLVLAIGGIVFWFHGAGATPALADFLKPIAEAKTLTCKVTHVGEGQQLVTIKEMIMATPNRSRTERELPDGLKVVDIIDNDTGSSVTLFPNQKLAIITTCINIPQYRPKSTDIWLDLRSQLANAGNRPDWIREPLGEKTIDGQRLIGYRLTGHGLIADLWGDPRTSMPVRIESRVPSSPSEKPNIYSDFVFNANLDESLFSLEPPAGYKVRKETIDASPAQEKDLVEMFRRYGELRDGALPDQLDLHAFLRLFYDHWNKSHPSEAASLSDQEGQKRLDAAFIFTRGISFAFEELPREAEAHYAGKGVKLGAADTPIFWYHPKDSRKYRIIYADLSVREAGTAPNVPNAQPVVSASGLKK